MRQLAACWIAIAALATHSAAAQDKNTIEVKKDEFAITVTIDGLFESKKTGEIKAETESWTDLKIKSVVEEGDRVEKGSTVVEFKTDDYERKLEDSKLAFELSNLAFQEAELSLGQATTTFGMDKELADRGFQMMREDYGYYKEVELPRRKISTDRNLRNSEYSLEYAQEELNQLEKMYNEDELTEESEGIVLKRARRGVDNSEYYLDSAKLSHKRSMEKSIPRDVERREDQYRRAELAYEKQKVDLDANMKKKQIGFTRQKMKFDKEKRDLEKLIKDQEQLTLKAPMSGIVLYGAFTKGKRANAAGKLKEDSAVTPKKPFITIVDPDNMRVIASVDETKFGKVKQGMAAKISPKAFPDEKLTGTLAELAGIPTAQNTFDCKFEFPGKANGLMPGMTCKVEIEVYRNKQAITLPKESVFSEGDQHFVYVATDKDKHEKRKVKVGQSDDKKMEIVDGLAEGEKVLKTKPNGKPAATAADKPAAETKSGNGKKN